jgi:hypothetical protein
MKTYLYLSGGIAWTAAMTGSAFGLEIVMVSEA